MHDVWDRARGDSPSLCELLIGTEIGNVRALLVPSFFSGREIAAKLFTADTHPSGAQVTSRKTSRQMFNLSIATVNGGRVGNLVTHRCAFMRLQRYADGC